MPGSIALLPHLRMSCTAHSIGLLAAPAAAMSSVAGRIGQDLGDEEGDGEEEW